MRRTNTFNDAMTTGEVEVDFGDGLKTRVPFSVETFEGRIESLEVSGGLAPGDVSDATVTSLVNNDGSSTHAAIASLVAESTPALTEDPANPGLYIIGG